MSTNAPVGMPEVGDFILQRATADELDRLVPLMRQRHQTLREQASADVGMDSVVVLADLSRQYLNGLRGTVVAVTTHRGKTHVTVRLDANSVTRLATSSTKYAHAYGQDSYDLPGIPITCCRTVKD
jgi:hypothetical protein